MLFKFLESSLFEITSPPIKEEESKEYNAYRVGLNNKTVLFRCAKITPTKLGQFVTVWKRPHKEIAPIDEMDDIDFVVVCLVDGEKKGVFVFPKKALLAHNVFSKNGAGGKRAFRVYPSWVTVDAKDAIKTQKWQLQYFSPTWSDIFLPD